MYETVPMVCRLTQALSHTTIANTQCLCSFVFQAADVSIYGSPLCAKETEKAFSDCVRIPTGDECAGKEHGAAICSHPPSSNIHKERQWYVGHILSKNKW